MENKDILQNLTESNLIDLAGQRGHLKSVLNELNRRKFGLLTGEMGGVNPVNHAKSIESLMTKLGRGERRKGY